MSWVSRLTIALCRIGFGSAGASTFAALVGICDAIAKAGAGVAPLTVRHPGRTSARLHSPVADAA